MQFSRGDIVSELTPVYHTTKSPGALPTWVTKLAYRLLQLSHRPGVYHFTLIVTEDGRKRLEIMMSTKTEELGT